MKKILCLSLAVVALAAAALMPANAEQTENLPPVNKKFFPEMKQPQPNWTKMLKLDEQQQAQLETIRAESQPQIQAIMQQIETLHQQMANIRSDDEQKLRAILNEKQLAKFEKLKTREAKHHRKPQPRAERSQRFKRGEN